MNRYQDVHFRLVNSLPSRTVEAKLRPIDPRTVYSSRKPGELRWMPEEQDRLIRRAQQMRANSVERVDIAEALDISMQTLDRYLATDLSTAPKGAKRR